MQTLATRMSKRKINPPNSGVLKLVTANNLQEIPAPSEAKFKKVTRNPNFDHTETDTLITIWGSLHNDLKQASKRSQALQEIADRMQKCGYKRSIVEINTRIKNIKCMYNRMRKDIELGLLREPTWRHYDAIDQVLKYSELTADQTLHSAIPDSALMESIGETRESLNESLPEPLVQVKTEPVDVDDLLLPLNNEETEDSQHETNHEEESLKTVNHIPVKDNILRATLHNNRSTINEGQLEIKTEPIDEIDSDLPLMTPINIPREKPEVEILRIPPRKLIEKPNINVKMEQQIRRIHPPELTLSPPTTAVQKTIDTTNPATKFIIFRHQSGSNYLQQVPNNVISLNPGLKIRPISELSKPTPPQQPQLLPTSVPSSVLKLLKDQQMTEPPQLASLSTNTPQFSPTSHLMSILKPKELPKIAPKIAPKITVDTTQSAVSPSAKSSGSSEASTSAESEQPKKNSLHIQLQQMIEISKSRLEIEKSRFEFEKKVGNEILGLLRKLTDS